jgi:glycosyltransferase involved in cell wall biosynthesis
MRLLIVCPAFPPAYIYGGTPLTAYGLAKGLINQGHEVLVLTTNANGDANLTVPLGIRTLFDGVPVLYHPRWKANPFFFASGLADNLRDWGSRYDIALLRGNWQYINLVGSWMLHKKIPFLIYPEGTFDPWAWAYRRVKKRIYWHLIEKHNYQRAAGIVALTQNEARQVKAIGIKPPVKVILNGIFIEDFENKISGGSFDCKYAAWLKRPVALFLGRIHVKKGIDLLIKALALIHKDSRPILIIAGSGDKGYEEILKNQIRVSELEEDILFTGMVTGEEKLYLLQRSTIFVLPSKSEGLPLAALEAMACKKPVILTPWCNLPEVEQWQAGFTVENAPPKIAGAIKQMLTNKTWREKMGENAYTLIKQKFSWESVARQTVEFAERILEG